ncbi:hypothetical protein FD755_009278 [Muntiacus reevesi]|uniref:Methyltransferase domain-containing protein n=1 Tax=Muntiacus reevesi TaxID=9886 RepID=A0A5N3XUU7_MUNRE|nr:hypothetical protein FD755_009278 [Muntiacus reevesi]
MAASGQLPVTQDLSSLRAKLQKLLRFLREALPISNAHTVDFYTESVWEKLVDLPPETVLSALRTSAAAIKLIYFFNELYTSFIRINNCLFCCQRFPFYLDFLDVTDFPKIFCETSQKLVNVEAFALAAKYYSVQNLGVCTPFDQLLVALHGNQKQRTDENVKLDEFMNLKKSHEVQAMSELISSIAEYCGIKQIIDLGSGKGYLSSFLSLKYGLKVYGIDSSNTRGAEERNRKLKKHWKVYRRRSKPDVSGLALQTAKERKAQDEAKCEADTEGVGASSAAGQGRPSTSDFVLEFSGSVISDIRRQMENLKVYSHQEENLCFENAFSLRDLLPVNAIDPTSSSQIPKRRMSEASKERRKITSKSNESNIYSPLTSIITADSELHDIIKDLEDCLMVGLHTCGDLAPNTLRIFTSKSEVRGVCSVGCCYHLLSEEFENPHKGTDDRHVGKIYSKSSSFPDYVRKSLKKLGLDESKLPEKIIMDYYEKYKPRMNELEAFNMLKVVLAPCIETLILLDRLCYLKEQDDIMWSALVRLFDPVKSPRCYAIIALKKQ